MPAGVDSAEEAALCHLSGNWGRVAIDVYTRFSVRYPRRPLVQLSTPGLAVYSSSPEAADQNLAELVRLGRQARQLGCTTAMIACNTMHLLRPRFEAQTGLTMLDMVGATRLKLESFSKVGLVATSMSTRSGLYASDRWELVVPVPSEQDELQRMIEHCKGIIVAQPQPRLVEILEGLVARGAEALVLGCTDFPQLLPPGWCPSGAVLLDPIDALVELANHIVPRPPAPPSLAGAGEIVVVGGGIIGLSTALRLQEAGASVTVLAESFDHTCSHSAASWFIPDPTYGRGYGSEAAGFTGPLYKRWAHRSFAVMLEDAEGGAGFTQLREGVRLYTSEGAPHGMEPIVSGETSLAQFVPSFRELRAGDGAWDAVDVPAGVRDVGADLAGGVAFRTLCTDMHAYLACLRQRLQQGGASLITRAVSSLAEAALVPSRQPVAAIVNCAGLGCRELVGDETMIPVRGQTVLVHAPEQTCFFSLMTGDKQHPIHAIPQGNGTCIVGGCKYPDDSRELADPELSKRLLRQVAAWCPALRECSLVSERVGFRPFRVAGARVELEELASGPPVVHNYGHGDVGVILAWGCADDAVELVRRATSS